MAEIEIVDLPIKNGDFPISNFPLIGDLPIKSWKIPSYGRWWIFPNFALDRNVYQA